MANNNCKEGKIVPYGTLDKNIQEILREAVEARSFSYSPYSDFKVGACLETVNGKLYRGANIENASYTVGTCAERCAYFKAISEGHKKFKRIAVVAQQEKFLTTPCGACRQFMNEFDCVDVYIAKPELKEVLVTTSDELLPHSFKINEDYSFK